MSARRYWLNAQLCPTQIPHMNAQDREQIAKMLNLQPMEDMSLGYLLQGLTRQERIDCAMSHIRSELLPDTYLIRYPLT